MKPNVGSLARVLRIIVGLAILGAGCYFKSWLGLVGIVPLLTATFPFCPAYLPFGLSTWRLKNDQAMTPRPLAPWFGVGRVSWCVGAQHARCYAAACIVSW